jgi:MSHA pilin protein MshC
MRELACLARNNAGFTIVELVTVMVIAAVLAAVALPRLVDSYGTNERGFYDQVQAALRYGQKITLATQHNVCVTINPGTGPGASLTLQYAAGAGCGPLPVPFPGGSAPYSITAPANVALAGSSFQFDKASYGGPVPNVPPITVGNRTITVEAVTGYVH